MTDLQLCQMCAEAYVSPNVVAGPFAALVKRDEATGVVTVAHRGTWNLLGWVYDARFMMTPWWGGMVHRGFADAWLSLQDQVVGLIENAPSVYVTGHSLGGAQALLSIGDVQRYQLERVAVFGCPRVGNRAFCKVLNRLVEGKMIRYVNPGDPVPHLPPLFLRDWLGALWSSQPLNDVCYRHPCPATRLGTTWDAVTGFVRGAWRAGKVLAARKEMTGIQDPGEAVVDDGPLPRSVMLLDILRELMAPHLIDAYLEGMRRREVGVGL